MRIHRMLLALALGACAQSHGAGDPGRDAGPVDAGDVGACGPCPRPCCDVDPASGATIPPFCPPPDLECEGPPACPPVDCPPAPPNCRWDGTTTCDCGELVCEPPSPPPPSLACQMARNPPRDCMVDANCRIELHQYDCCGSEVALGIAVADLAGGIDDWRELERDCRDGYPDCDCMPAPAILTDTAEPAASLADVAVRCRGARCETYVP